MSMSDWDLLENCVIIFMGFMLLMFLLGGKGKD